MIKLHGIEKIEYFSVTLSLENHYQKKYIIKSNGKIIIFYYIENLKTPDYVAVFHTSPYNVKKLFFKIAFVLKHANLFLPYFDSHFGIIKIHFNSVHHKTFCRGFAIGIYSEKI